MDAKTYLAVGELVQAAAHAHGLVGPVEFTVCAVRDDDDEEAHPDRSLPAEEFFYAQSFA